MLKVTYRLFALVGLSLLALNVSSSTNFSSDISSYVQSPERGADFKARDQYRHPQETLEFFEIEPSLTVLEIWPAPGYYTEILAPMLKQQGKYIAAGFGSTAKLTPEWRKIIQAKYNDWAAENKPCFGDVEITELDIPERTEIISADDNVDRILTFRNVHNWLKGGYAEQMFRVFFDTLKPGGLLGIVEHRAKTGTTTEDMILSGYITEDAVIQLAKQSGFELVEKSEINANPKDTKDYPQGVWSLPPTLRLGDTDRDRYLSIGESDRMTLKFRKPVPETSDSKS